MEFIELLSSHSMGALGEGIRRARSTRGWTLDRLAEAVGVSKVSVWNWEKGRSRPRPEILEQIAAALQIPVEDLVTGIDAPKPGHSLAALVAYCQALIGQSVGIPPENVEIKITFGGEGDCRPTPGAAEIGRVAKRS